MGTKLLIASLVVLYQTLVATAQPALVSTDTQSASYLPGDQVDREAVVIDAEMKPVGLVELTEGVEVTVLILFGGAVKEVPSGPFRGRLWCEDSFDDLGVQRALVEHFRDESVRFVPVAIPPVYGPVRYGYEQDVFLGEREDSPGYRDAVTAFIRASELEREKTELPFDTLYYDPRAQLIRRSEEIGSMGSWEGKFKWRLDPRTYGTPTIWLLGPGGEVLADPFIGNDYDSSPPEINYGFTELKKAVEQFLNR